MKTFQAENGNTVTALNEVQAAAFTNAGLKPVEGKKPRKPKSE